MMAPLLLILTLLAAPPLTEPQKLQLDTARDSQPGWDEPALYPLLDNAVQWQLGDEAGATVPDYAAIHRDPQAHRGGLFLVEGPLGGAPQVMLERLHRPGAWEKNLQQWSVVIRRNPDEVAVVLLVDPMPPEALPTRGGDLVRIPARFFKVWRFPDRQGVPTDYLLFVGRGAKVQAAAAGTPVRRPDGGSPSGGSGSRGGSGGSMWLGLVIVVGLCALWYALRRTSKLSLKPKPVRSKRELLKNPVVDEPDEPLPQDPIEALKVLEQRHREEQQSPPPANPSP